MKLAYSFVALALSFSPFLTGVAAQAVDFEAAGVRPLRPLVDSEKLQASVKSEALLKHARQLLKFSELSNNNRAFGSKGHNATVNYIKKLLDETGYYDTYLQTFPYTYSENKAALAVNGESLVTAPFTYGPGGDIEAPLVNVNALGCVAEDYSEAVAGNIALIKRGECEYGLKVALAGAAGAVGAIIYNNADGGLGSGGTLAQPSRPTVGPYVPVGGISGLLGVGLVATINGGTPVIGKLSTQSFVEERYSSNVIATTKTGDKNNIVFAGAHSDSVAAGPGINDDGSGTIAILDIALHLPKYRVKNAVRFGWWTAEEFGLVGSEYHITNLSDEERQKIALYLNFDMLASPNSGYFIYDGNGDAYGIVGPDGSDKIEKLYEDWYASKGLKSGPAAFSGRSDYGPFLEVGIPSGGVLTGAEGLKTVQGVEWWGGEAGVAYDKCYHARCDTVDNLRVDVWLQNTKAAAHSIATYAHSIEGIPREPRASTARVSMSTLSYDERRHFSCNHVVSTQ